MKKKSKAIIISSVSGGGKTTIIRQLKKNISDLELAITATTREQRGKEKDGKDYYFYQKESFQKEVEKDAFLEYALVHGHYYGVRKIQVLEQLNNNRSIILNIDVQGMKTIKKKLGKEQVITFFIMPPNEKIWKERLMQRQTETKEQIENRIKQGYLEIEKKTEYDYIIVNDLLERAVKEIITILKNTHIIL